MPARVSADQASRPRLHPGRQIWTYLSLPRKPARGGPRPMPRDLTMVTLSLHAGLIPVICCFQVVRETNPRSGHPCGTSRKAGPRTRRMSAAPLSREITSLATLIFRRRGRWIVSATFWHSRSDGSYQTGALSFAVRTEGLPHSRDWVLREPEDRFLKCDKREWSPQRFVMASRVFAPAEIVASKSTNGDAIPQISRGMSKGGDGPPRAEDRVYVRGFGGSAGPPDCFHAPKPPSTWATSSRPISLAVFAARADRQPPAQKNIKRLSSAKTGL
jgi:hypothetical protein